jgi:ATP-binding cassette subfamily B protein
VLGVATAARFYMVSWLGERVTADIRSAVYRHVVQQSPEFFETTRTGEVLSRLTTDTTLIQAVVGTSISLALRNTLLFVGGLAMLFVTSAKLTSIILGLLVLVVVPIVLFGRRVRKLSRDSQDRIADASAMAGEILNAMPTVQAFTHESREARRFGVRRRRLRDRDAAHPRALHPHHAGHRAGVRRHRVRAVAGRARGAGRQHDGRRPRPVHPVRVHRVRRHRRAVRSDGRGAARGRRHRAPAGTAGRCARASATPRIRRRCRRAGRRRGAPAARRRLLVPVAPGPRGAGPPEPGHEARRDGGRGRPVRRRQDHAVPAAAALLRPAVGAIRLDGVDIRDLDLHVLRGAIGIVPQDTVIFSADAMENIRYGRPTPATRK